MSMPLPAERLSFLLILRNEFLRSPELVIGRAALPMSMPLPSERLNVHSFEEWVFAPQSSLLVEPALLPSPRGPPYEACRSLLSGGVPSHSEEWVPRSPELMVGLDAPLWAAECLLILRNEFSAPQSSMIIALPAGRASIAPLTIEGYLWACRSLLSGEFPSHSEEWVPRSPELMMGLAAPFWAAECLLILRNEFSTLQSSL